MFIQNRYAGTIEETEDGYRFAYDEEYYQSASALPVSLMMPLTQQEYSSTILFPFFDGLIPEGWLLKVVSRNWKIDVEDRFGLLLSACRDCIGDVCIRNEEME